MKLEQPEETRHQLEKSRAVALEVELLEAQLPRYLPDFGRHVPRRTFREDREGRRRARALAQQKACAALRCEAGFRATRHPKNHPSHLQQAEAAQPYSYRDETP